MRKILFVMVAALAFVACEKDYQSVIEKTDLETVVHNNKVSLKQALLYAENSINGINPTTRSAERKVKSTELYVAKPATRSAEDTEVSFYLFNYEDNKGFAMVSTDSRATPVYAYSDSGNLTTESFENNPGLQIFMNGAIPYYEDEIANYITYGIGDDRWPIDIPDTLDDPRPISVDGTLCYINTDTTTMVVDSLLTTAWHQDMPYNAYTSDYWNGNYPTGCGPTAIAQIMAYYRHPLSHNSSDTFGLVIYDWDLMLSNIRSNPGESDTDATLAISKLMYQIGEEAEARPRDGKTWTNPNDLIEALNEFGYTSSNVVDFSSSIIKSQIDANKPVYVTGVNPDTGVGHDWVIDGYEFENRISKYYYAEPPFNLYKTTTHTTKYFHCNWGNPGFPYDTLENGLFLATGFTYTEDNQMIYNITPNI